MRCANATELYIAMMSDIESNHYERLVDDKLSPRRNLTYEAVPGCSYVLVNHRHNCVAGLRINGPWAAAYVLHFFADTENAGDLRKYNENADRFLEGDRLVGAYGFAAMPGIRRCVERLQKDPASRRAVVSLGGLDDGLENINLPRCISFMHFLIARDGLELVVYQRSLSTKVMPYDCILLCNVLNYAATMIEVPVGGLRWIVGSLHSDSLEPPQTQGYRDVGVVLPVIVLDDSRVCRKCLRNPETVVSFLPKGGS